MDSRGSLPNHRFYSQETLKNRNLFSLCLYSIREIFLFFLSLRHNRKLDESLQSKGNSLLGELSLDNAIWQPGGILHTNGVQNVSECPPQIYNFLLV